MANSKRRWSENQRSYAGEDKAAVLVGWLNSLEDPSAPNHQSTTRAKAHIAEILDGLAIIASKEDDQVEDCRALAAHLNELLSDCALIPQIEINVWQPLPLPSKTKVGCSLDFQPAPGTEHHAEMAQRVAGVPVSWPYAHHLFMLLFDIWRSGHIANLRRCDACNKFLYKRFPTQRTCGKPSRCREKAYKERADYKAARNKRRREAYREAVLRDKRNREWIERK